MLRRSQDDPEAEVNDAGDDVDGLGKDKGEGCPGTVLVRTGIAVSPVPPLSCCHQHGTEGLYPRDTAVSPPAVWAAIF